MTWTYSIGAVYVFLFVVGTILSTIAGYMLCGKTGASQNFKEGAIWAAYPTGVYIVATYFERVKAPYVNTLSNFGVPESIKDTIGLGYLLMLGTWIASVWTIHNTEKGVCNPSIDEMAEFKKNLLSELKKKQEAEQKNKDVKTDIEKTKPQ